MIIKGAPEQDKESLHREIQELREKIREDLVKLGDVLDNNVVELATHPLWLQRHNK